jgi:hypothetical protein
METRDSTVKVWRERAEALRVIADGFTDPLAHSNLVQVAKMAERAPATDGF